MEGRRGATSRGGGGVGAWRREGNAVNLGADSGADILAALGSSEEVAGETEEDGEENEREGDDDDKPHGSLSISDYCSRSW